MVDSPPEPALSNGSYRLLPALLSGLGPLFVLLLLVCTPGVAAGAESAAIRSIEWLVSAQVPAGAADADLLRLTGLRGQSLASFDDVPYQPFEPIWLALQVQRSEGQPAPEFLRVSALQRRELDVLLVVDGRVVARASGGYSRSSPWQAMTSPDVALPLAAWRGANATVLLRSVTTERLPLRAYFVDADELRAGAVMRAGFLLFFSGCALVFIAVQFLIYRRMQEPASRDYSLFIGVSLLMHLNRAGYLSFDLWPGEGSLFLGDLQDYGKLAAILLALRALESYLELESWSPALQRINRTLQIVVLSVALLFQFMSVAAFQAVVSLAYAPLCIWALVATIFALRARRRGAGLLLVAWTGLASAALYVNLSILGLFTSGPYLQFIVPLGLLWEMVFNGGGLLVKLDLIREERHTAKLREIELKGLGRLVRVVCHDISNPLMVVRFALDRIRSFNRTNGEPSALTDPLRLAEQGERAIEAVIEDVRAMEQLRATGGKLAVLPVDLAGLTREALAMFGSRTAEKKVTVLDSLPVSVMAFGIPGILVRSVIANILANAIKFTPEGSSITLQIETQPERVGLRITDTGPGIPAETLAALARAEPLASRLGSAGERGTGFGLQLAQDFATAMGGGLTFQVPAPGAATGTAVTIWLRAT